MKERLGAVRAAWAAVLSPSARAQKLVHGDQAARCFSAEGNDSEVHISTVGPTAAQPGFRRRPGFRSEGPSAQAIRPADDCRDWVGVCQRTVTV